MSGSKRATVEIGHEEYERLRNAENALRLVKEAPKRSEENLHAQSIAGIKAGLEWMQTRQQDFESLVGSFNGHLSAFEAQTVDQLNQQQQYLLERIAESEENSSQAVFTVLDQNLQGMQNQMARLHQQNQADVASLYQQIALADQNEREKTEIASEWCESAASLAAFIRANYQPEFFFPGDLYRYETQIAQARDNLALNMPEAVFFASQSLYFTLSEFRLRLEQLENEWRILFYSAWEEALKVHAWFLENETIPAVDLNGEEINVTLDVDYWSDHRWSRTIQAIEGLIKQFEDQDAVFDSQALRGILENDIPSFNALLVEIIRDARIAALNSQLRVNIADLVIEALCEQGFSLREANYAHDMRHAYGARLVSYDGGEVIVNVSPTGRKIGENQLEVQSHDEQVRSEHELRQRWFEINRSLAGKGLEVRNPQVLRPGGIPAAQPRKSTLKRQQATLANLDG